MGIDPIATAVSCDHGHRTAGGVPVAPGRTVSLGPPE